MPQRPSPNSFPLGLWQQPYRAGPSSPPYPGPPLPLPRISALSFPSACLLCPHPCPHRGRHQQLAGGREGGVLFPSRSSQFLAPKCCQENRQLPLSVMCSTNKADFSQHCHFSCKAILMARLPRNLSPVDSTPRKPSQIAQTLGLTCTHFFLSFPNHGLILHRKNTKDE